MGLRGLVVASVIVGASVLAGCGAAADGEATAASGTSASTKPSESSPAPTGSATTTLHPDAGTLPDDWPAEAFPVHGGEVWAIYLAVGPAGDPELAEAAEWLEARGYTAGEAELGCDGGAAEALGRDPQEHAVAVYFEYRADAGDFLALMKPPGSPEQGRGFVEMLRVTRYCLD